jgi:ATP-binding cassette subfamily B protein
MKKSDPDATSKKVWDRSAWSDAAFFWKYLAPHQAVFIPALFALGITAGLAVVFLYLLVHMVGPALDGLKGPELLAHAHRHVWLVVVVVALQSFIAFWRILLFAKASERALAALRMDTFGKIIRLPMEALNRRRVGELASRLANDVESMRETLVVTIPQLIRHTVMLVASIVLVLNMSVKLSLFMIGTVPVVLVLIAIFGARIRKLSRKAQDDLAASQVVVDESLQSIISVKAFRNEDHETRRYTRHLSTFLDTAIRAALPRATFIAFIIFSFSVALTLVTWFAIRMVGNGEILHTQLLGFGAFSSIVAVTFMNLPELITQLQRTLGATERVREILEDVAEPDEPATATVPRTRFRGEIEMRDIRFAYPSRPEVTVLQEFSFSARAGQRIALVGPSGSGKTTTASLLFRFYEPDEGVIKIDGTDIRQIPLATLRPNLALVPQEVLLFGGSIRENIAYGKPAATDGEIIAAARLANAHQFIEKLPESYDTVVGERGTQLSGGQRQRIAIARAILADPAILILDEATSSLDAESERLVQEALDKLMENRTSIIIAHRLSTVRRADQILVLSAGTIIERGTHEELVKNEHSLYATLAKLQLEG